MSKKVYALVKGVLGGVTTIASTVVAFINPTYCVAIIASIGILATAIDEICAQFVKA